jgi:hypothetical protein
MPVFHVPVLPPSSLCHPPLRPLSPPPLQSLPPPPLRPLPPPPPLSHPACIAPLASVVWPPETARTDQHASDPPLGGTQLARGVPALLCRVFTPPLPGRTLRMQASPKRRCACSTQSKHSRLASGSPPGGVLVSVACQFCSSAAAQLGYCLAAAPCTFETTPPHDRRWLHPTRGLLISLSETK